MTSSKSKFCSNCGETLENLNYEEVKKCPKCGIDLIQPTTGSTIRNNRSVVEQLPYKSPGTAALIAFIGGVFGLPGIGHMYVGKIGRGIVILVSGIIIYILFAIMTFSLASQGSTAVIIMMVIFGIVYFAFWIWQIFNARKLAKEFNELVRTTGKEPW